MQRRCIHDELGRVDPSKAAEPSKPRGSAAAKRPPRPSDEHGTPTAKRPKLESGVSDAETILVGQAQSALAADLNDEQNGQVDFDSLIDPALVDTPSAPPPPPQPILGDAITQLRAATDAMTKSTKDMAAARTSGSENMHTAMPQKKEAVSDHDEFSKDSKLLEQTQVDPSLMAQAALTTMPSASSQTPAGSLASPPDSLLQDPGYSPTAMGNVELAKSIETNGEGSESSGNPLHTPNSNSRHSSRQPKQIDQCLSNAATRSQMPAPEETRYNRRASSSGVSALTSIDEKSRRSSNVSIRSAQMQTTERTEIYKAESPASQGHRVSRGRSSFGDPDMDEESLKLIKALQQEDLGLRRRGRG